MQSPLRLTTGRVAATAVCLVSIAAFAPPVALVACGRPDTPGAAQPTAPAPVSTVASAAPAAQIPAAASATGATASPAQTLPSTAAGKRLSWVLASLANHPSEADVTAVFSPNFTHQVPPSQLLQVLAQVGAALSPVVVDHVESGGSEQAVSAVLRADKPGGQRMRVRLAVERADPSRIEGLLFTPVADDKPAASWDDVKSRIAKVAHDTNLLAAEIEGGKCIPLAAVGADHPLALGSAFKLYVLEALATQIEAGKHTWNDPITIEEGKKSLPSGDLRNEPAGKTLPVKEVAERMIAVSDNTAADHLLAFVGRKAVEDAVKASGHSAPRMMTPFLSTRDLFAMKILGSAEELRAYDHADVAHKRKLLEGFESRDLSKVLSKAEEWTSPRSIDSLEWFASPFDLCKLMVSLKRHAEVPATAAVSAILSKNPGVPDENGAYSYIGYKGGSEPGVLNLTWLLQRKAGGKWLFLTVGFNDPKTAFDEQQGVFAAAAAREYLAK